MRHCHTPSNLTLLCNVSATTGTRSTEALRALRISQSSKGQTGSSQQNRCPRVGQCCFSQLSHVPKIVSITISASTGPFVCGQSPANLGLRCDSTISEEPTRHVRLQFPPVNVSCMQEGANVNFSSRTTVALRADTLNIVGCGRYSWTA